MKMFTFFVFWIGSLNIYGISDFSPLVLGNSWEYIGYFSGEVTGYSERYNIVKIIRIDSEYKSNDTDVYRISVRDSLYKMTITGSPHSDSIAQSYFTLTQYGGKILGGNDYLHDQDIHFFAHNISDSLLNKPDTVGSYNTGQWINVLLDPINYLGNTVYPLRRVYKYLIYNNSQESDSIYYLQNIGIIYSTKHSFDAFSQSQEYETFQIVKFNNVYVNVPGIPDVPSNLINKKRNNSNPKGFSTLRGVYIMDNTIMNLLGRKIMEK